MSEALGVVDPPNSLLMDIAFRNRITEQFAIHNYTLYIEDSDLVS